MLVSIWATQHNSPTTCRSPVRDGQANFVACWLPYTQSWFLRTPFISEMISIYAFFNRPVVFYFRGMSFMFVVCWVMPSRYIRREMESASPNSLRYGSLGAQLGTLTAVTQFHKTCVAVLWRWRGHSVIGSRFFPHFGPHSSYVTDCRASVYPSKNYVAL